MKTTVTVTKVLEEWWGIEDILPEFDTLDAAKAVIIELLIEDIPAFLDGAKWDVAME